MPKRALSHLCAFLTVLFWSSAYVFTPIALKHFSVTGLAFVRCAVASICLALLLRGPLPPQEAKSGPGRAKFRLARLGKALTGLKAHLPRFVLSGASGFALYVLAFNKGSLSLNPTTSCIIISTSPIISAVMARCYYGERLRAAQWLSILLAFCGILVLTLRDGSLELSAGIFWMTGAALLISLYTILQRGLCRSFTALEATTGSFFTGTLLLAPFLPTALAELGNAPLSLCLLAVFLGLCPSALAYWLWTKALGLATQTSTVSNYMFLTPFLALLLDFAVTGLLPGAGALCGGAIILAGLLLFATAGKAADKKTKG